MRLSSCCRRGERMISHVPQRHWKTIVAAGSVTVACERPCAVDVVIDKLPAHKVRDAIEARGATLRYLLQYSPDLNPIEMSFSPRPRTEQFMACVAELAGSPAS